MNLNESYQQFLQLLDQPKLKDLLKHDECKMIADKYLLATVFIFFRKANLDRKEYNRKNFYVSLYLAHDMQEDIEDFKDDIIDNYLGANKFLKRYYVQFLKDRFALFQRMGFNCNVTQEMCEDIMKRSSHWAWKRVRNSSHGGVFYKHNVCRKCGSIYN